MVYLIVLALLVIFSQPAHAYVDAGSGSYMLQMSLAGLMAGVFSLKIYWQKLKSFASQMLSRRPSSRPTGAA